MSPVGEGVLSLTKFYRLRELVGELGDIVPGMTQDQVRGTLGAGHKELFDDLVLYTDGLVVAGDPMLDACRVGAPYARLLVWVALVMADHRLAEVVETVLTDANGHLIPARFNTGELERRLVDFLPDRGTHKPATNILSYFRDAGIVEPQTYGSTVIGVLAVNPTAHAVPPAVDYITFRLNHLGLAQPAGEDACAEALGVLAHHWLVLTPVEFRAAYDAMRAPLAAPAPPPPPAPQPVAIEVPVEEHNTETYDVAAHDETVGRRQEQPLVLAYQAWMQARGCEIVRLRFRPPGVTNELYCDLYDETRNHLVEAKADERRGAIRMAVGQLADYVRFAPPPMPERAVLTSHRLPPDLEGLLASVGIASIWRNADSFEDNAGGRFT